MSNIHVEIIGADEWVKEYSENAHLIAFNRTKPASWDRIDYAMLFLAKEEGKPDLPVGYVTCREHDHETVYWQYGGAMPDTKGSVVSVQAFKAGLDWAKLHYKRVTLVVENTNRPMLKMAFHTGFTIHGVRTYNNFVMLEHMKEF